MVRFVCTVDLWNLLHFLGLRDDGHAQAEIAEYAQAVSELVEPYFPTVVKHFQEVRRVQRALGVLLDRARKSG